jgi:anti-sigma factor RsiW
MSLRTCKEFLRELSEFLDNTLDAESRLELEQHVNNCPNCFVVTDTTKRTIQVYKGMEPKVIPEPMRTKLMEAVRKKMAAKKCPADRAPS